MKTFNEWLLVEGLRFKVITPGISATRLRALVGPDGIVQRREDGSLEVETTAQGSNVHKWVRMMRQRGIELESPQIGPNTNYGDFLYK